MKPTAVLLMAYGSPDKIEDVEEYYVNVRGGRLPTPAQVENLTGRYRTVGGHTPLTELTQQVADKLQTALDQAAPGQYKTYIGMKYWHPLIPDTVQQMLDDGVEKVIAIALAPHYSKISIGGYVKQVERALDELNTQLDVTYVQSWQAQPKFRQLIADRITAGLTKFPDELRAEVMVLFSAHSLPERILQWEDPYPQELESSAQAIAEALNLPNWMFTYQSQGETGDPWLGPDILDTLEKLGKQGVRYVLSVPFGFVSDHLEILYDIDIECHGKAQDCGIKLSRIRLPNADDPFIDLLATIVKEQVVA